MPQLQRRRVSAQRKVSAKVSAIASAWIMGGGDRISEVVLQFALSLMGRDALWTHIYAHVR